MPLVSPRQLFLFAFLACVAIMGGALHLKHVAGPEACPLCVVQRIFFILTGLTCPAGVIQGPGLRGRCIYLVLVFLPALGGGVTVARQVWLQTVPLDQLPICLSNLGYMAQALPLQEVIRLILHGTADCTQMSWTPFTLSTPEWSLLASVAYPGFSIVQFLRCA